MRQGRPMVTRDQKITLGEMRASGVRDLLVYCADYKCSRGTRMSADRWPDRVRLSDLEPLFVCQACGRRGADNQAGLGLGNAAKSPPRLRALTGACHAPFNEKSVAGPILCEQQQWN